MILSDLQHSARYEGLHPLFKRLFDYVKSHDLSQVPAERIVLEGDQLYINVADVELKHPGDQKLEVHRRYLDVHFPLSGPEICGFSSLHGLGQPDAPFDEQDDYALYSQSADTYFTIQPGQFYIVYPEDAHAPIIGQGSLRKLIAKVAL